MVRRAAVLLPFLLAGCEEKTPDLRPQPTPGPQIVVRESTARLGTDVERGERVRFAVIGTGAGTHFGSATFLYSPAFSELQVVAVLSTSRLIAQGVVSLAAGEGMKDIAAVTGAELAVAPWAFRVRPTALVELGNVPTNGEDVLDPAGDFDVFRLAPPTDALLDLIVKVVPQVDDFDPSLELYDARGRLLGASDTRCVAVRVNSRSPLYARVADPTGAGGPDHRYRIAAGFGHPASCLAAGDLVP